MLACARRAPHAFYPCVKTGSPQLTELFHIIGRDAWVDARRLGIYAPVSLRNEGFIHLSADHQVVGTANRFYGAAAELLVLVVDEGSLGSALVWEEGEPGMDFPHLYRPLEVTEVTEVRRLRRGEDGAWSAVVPGSDEA